MTGINIPFVCLEINDDNEIIEKNPYPIVMGPIQNGTYNYDHNLMIMEQSRNL